MRWTVSSSHFSKRGTDLRKVWASVIGPSGKNRVHFITRAGLAQARIFHLHSPHLIRRHSMTRSFRLLSTSLLALVLAACSTAPKITRTDVDETIDLSGNWNDTDSRLTAEEMV